ncbi:cyclic nucleotide-binding domain-containing protein [Ophiostoma piceae UAMH 11346]|uniref:Cyclic nucleotide-binding domain-containing protein n=1 Tax=Ophiostoma piceae (strain UAMH 11346) TaxID=1262450 RepID=S3CCT7_OPHP1|nr:cyclic nucleotide-binding domain-containing protein [Ophiostoma piceae UAMH 11346]
MRRARGPSPTSPFRALAHHHASHGNGQQTPASVSSMIRSFNVETNPTRPMRPSPLTASTIKDMPLDLVDRIRSFPLFMSAPDDFLAAIGKHLRPQIHGAHDHILTEGDDAKAMYWLVRGVVAVTSRDGEAIYAELKPGAFFGEIGVLMDVPRTATIVARTKCLLVVLKKEDLQTELPHYPDMEKAIRQEAEERLTILKKKQQERRSPASSTGTSGSLGSLANMTERRAMSAFDSSSSSSSTPAPGDAPTGDGGMVMDSTVVNSKKRKSPSPGIIEDPAVGGSALGSGYVNVRKTLKELPLFSTLPPDILHFLGLSAQPKTYSPFTDIIRQGSSGQDIYFIVNGEAEVIHELPNGKVLEAESTFSRPRLTQGQYFGEVASLGLSRGRRTATVRSITSVECLMISSEALDELWKRCPPDLKHQVEETARLRYNQQQAEDAAEAEANALNYPRPDLGEDVEMKDTDSHNVETTATTNAGSPTWPLPRETSPASSLRRHSVPNVTFTTPSKPSSPTKATKEEAETRQPSDPDPFLSVDMENMRNRRRNSLAPPTPQTDSSLSTPSSPSPPSQSTPMQQIQQSNDINANSSPLKLFTFPPLTTPPPEGPLPKAPERSSIVAIGSSKLSQEESRGPFKKARTLGRPPPSRRSGTPSSATGATFTLPFSTRQFPPEDALVLVFQRFEFAELVRLAGVCRQWRRILLTSPQLCTHVDLSSYNSMINDWSVINIIAPFIGLRAVEIDISNCFHITDEGFQALWKRCGKNIKAWRMKSVWDVSANQILDMSENAPGLEEIDWSNCRKVGDNLLARVVGWVVPQPPPTVPSNKIVAIASSNANRSRHHKEQHKEQQQQPPAKQGPPPGTVIGCPNLKILDLSYCKHITDRSMVHLAAHASNRLRSISLTRCTSISDAGFQAWAPYRFNHLTHLCLADCTYLSDNAIVSLVNAAKNLTHLDLSFCCALSDTATEVVALGLPMLQELRLAFCGSAVSDASLRCIALHLNDLRGLSVRGCVRVTGVGVEHVLDGCARLEWLDASQCKNLASWVVAGGIGRWGYDERSQRGRSSSSAWKTANRRSMGLEPAVKPGAVGADGVVIGAAGAPPSMRGQRRRARKPVKFIVEKGATDGLR